MNGRHGRPVMTRLLAVLALGVWAGAAVAQKSSEREYESDAGRYTVTFPAKPSKKEDDRTVATAGGNLVVVTTRCEANGVIYSVAYTDYPTSFREVNASRILEGVVSGMKGDSKDATATELSDGEHSGRLVGVNSGENAMRAKVLLVGQRLYLVQVSGRKKAVATDATDKFLSSFVLDK
jgi:hypothetical protein